MDMNVQKTITKLDVKDFSIGKIYRWTPWKTFVFLFDVGKPAIIQFSEAYKVLSHTPLPDVVKIDSVFFDGNRLLIADSNGKKIHRWELIAETETTDSPVSLTNYAAYLLSAGSIITAFNKIDNFYLLLDKGMSMIRIHDRDLNPIKTVGSRMGYVQLFGDEEPLRLGFEFPEDIAVIGDKIIVSDSGNKRLVVIDPIGEEWEQEKIIPLPEYPYKIIFYQNRRVVVSDFDRSFMTVSLDYGYIHREESEYPLDFFQSHSSGGTQCLTGSELGNEIVELQIPEISDELLAIEAGNYSVLMRVLIDNGRLDEARRMALSDEILLPEYAKYTADETVKMELTSYVEKTVKTALEKIEPLKTEILNLSIEFINIYKSIPDSEDKEAAQIDKENIRHRLFLQIKKYRALLKTVNDLKIILQKHPEPSALFSQILESHSVKVKDSIEENLRRIDAHLSTFNEGQLLETIVSYWLLTEEEGILFREIEWTHEKIFNNLFILAILNDFYYHIAEVFLRRGKIDQYISFADREITMYNDKLGIFKKFVERLLQLNKTDDVLRMLEKFPDKNKEDINYYYFRAYKSRGETDKAFLHLRKELELYSHRIDLIPSLIRLRKMNREENQAYIEKILEKSGQGIDIYLIVAQAFEGIGDIEGAEIYIDKELRHFPENQNAIAFKLNHLLNGNNSEELKKWLPRLTALHFSLLRSKVYFVLKDFKNSWSNFIHFVRSNTNEAAAFTNLFLATSLNYIHLSESEIRRLRDLADRVSFDAYKIEFYTYLSFLKYFGEKSHGFYSGDVEKYEVDIYLSANSTGILAYNYFLQQLKLLKAEQKWDELIVLAKSILKYNPGDQGIFNFLDQLVV